MKKPFDLRLIIILVAAVLYTISSSSQGFMKLDEAPHDISYYRESRVTSPLVKVLYGRPSITTNDKVFGNVIPYNEIWRTGANEATEIKIYKDVLFGDRLVAAGTYVLYTIPGENQWEVILSSNTDVLGAFQYDSVFDVARIMVPVKKGEKLDTFSIGFKRQGEQHISMLFAWGSTRVKVPLNFNEQEYYADSQDFKIKFKN